MLEIPINHSPTNVWVNFCWNSYIISLGGSRFFCYGQKRNLDLQKRKLYISIGTKPQKSQGLRFNCRLPGTRHLYGRSFGRDGTFYRRRQPSSRSPPAAVPRRLGALPVHRLGQCGPLSRWAGLQPEQPQPIPLA